MKRNMPPVVDIFSLNRLNLKRLSYCITASEARYIYMALGQRDFYAAYATVDGKIAGLICCPPDTEDRALSVTLLRVFPEYKRKKIGTALLRFIAALAAENGKETLYASYVSDNAQATGFFHYQPGEERLRNIEVRLLHEDSIRQAMNIPMMHSPGMKLLTATSLKEYSESLSNDERKKLLEQEADDEQSNIFEEREVFYAPVFSENYSEKYSRIISVGNRPVAWVLSKEEPEQNRLKICKMYIDPAYRHAGAFARLAVDQLTMALEDGYTVYWWVMHWTGSFFKGCMRWQEKAGLDEVHRYYVKRMPLKELNKPSPV